MATYRYEAANDAGELVRGLRNAPGQKELREMLSRENLSVFDAQEVKRDEVAQRLRTAELADFCRQLGTMLKAGVPMIRSIAILMERDSSARVRSIYTALFGYLQAGNSLSESMELQGGFPPLIVSALRASEMSGKVDITALEMAEHYEKEHRVNGKIKAAAVYPCFLLGLIVAVLALIFNFVLPRFTALFEGLELPAITRFVLSMADAFQNNGLLILAGVLTLVLIAIVVARIPAVRLALDRTKLRLPYVGKLLRVIYTSRFARTLSSLYASGLTILNALQSVRDTIGNSYVASQFDKLIADVRSGSNLSQAVAEVDGFDKKLASTIAIGEESGNLDYMLAAMADSFDFESDQAISRLTALVEPALIIVMALVIGIVMVAVMMPMLTLYDAIGSGYGSY